MINKARLAGIIIKFFFFENIKYKLVTKSQTPNITTKYLFTVKSY